MESKRQQQVAKLIQKELSEIFQRDARHLFSNEFITITSVRITPDLSIARVYLSFLMSKNKSESLENIEEKNKNIRTLLAQKIKNNVRIIPELKFFLDDSAEYAERIEELLNGLHIPPASEEEEDKDK